MIRPLFGMFLAINLLFLWPDRHLFFGAEGLIPDDIYEQLSSSSWKISTFVPRTVWGVDAYFLTLFACLGSLMIGWYPRCSALCVFVLLSGLYNSNTLIFDGEDTVFRLFAFFLIFAPGPDEIKQAGLPGKTDSTPYPIWPLRLFQVQMTAMMLACVWQKLRGEAWLDGTAMYYVTRLDDFQRLPLPELITENLLILKMMTWSVLLLELIAPVLLWFRKTRRATILVLLTFHLTTDLTMNLMMFHWIMMTGWMSFVTYDDFSELRGLFRRRVEPEKIEAPLLSIN
ncbi:HTTM domain-containing protein [Planctomycetaceae bacterium]|nr:HTTM domain-containing protein [Planctomycetaceae bacterium]